MYILSYYYFSQINYNYALCHFYIVHQRKYIVNFHHKVVERSRKKPDVYTDLQFMDKDTTPLKTYDSAGGTFVILLKDMDLIKSVLLH